MYAIFVDEKNTGHKWVYGQASDGRPDLLPSIAATVSEEYLYTYPTEEIAKEEARRVIPKEAFTKHHVFICEKEADGYRAVLEVLPLETK